MANPRYSMSFTTGALLYSESLRIAELYSQAADWNLVRQQVLAGNLLQMRTANAAARVSREAISRLKLLTPPQRELLLAGSASEQRCLLWLAMCKRYRFIYDFALEVLHEKFLRLDLRLTPAEYDRFFERKREWHPEVENVTPATRAKQRQVVFKAMTEAGIIDTGIIDTGLNIVPALLTPALAAAIAADSPGHFALYPVSERDIAQWTP